MTDLERRRRAYGPRGSLVLAALDELPDASIMVFDTELVYVVVRGESVHQAGLDPADIEERFAGDVLPPSRWALYEPLYRAALQGQTSSLEIDGLAGTSHRFQVTVGPVRDSNGVILGGVAVSADISSQVALRNALVESEARFRLLAENSSDVVVLVDDDWEIGWVSPSVHEVLGHDPAALLGTSLLTYVAASSADALATSYAGWTRSEPLRLNLQVVGSDGGSHWMDSVARSISEPGDAVTSTVVSLRDVDDQVAAQRALARSEEELRLTMDQAAVGMALVSADGRFLALNPALERFLGYSADELIGRSFLVVTHPDDVPGSGEIHRALVSGEDASVAVRKRYVRKDGVTVWADLDVAAVRAPDGSFRHNVAQMTDVTAEVTAAAEAEESRRLFRLLAENASDVVYLADPSGAIVWASPSFQTVLGLAPEEATAMRTEDLVHPDDLERVQSRRAAIYGGDTALPSVVRFRTTGGGYREMSVTVHVLTDDDGASTGAVVGLRDVTAEQAARRELSRSEERFRLAMAAAPVGMALADPDGAFVQVNAALCELLGLEESQLLGRSVADFLPPGAEHLAGEVSHVLDVERLETMRHEHQLVSSKRSVWVEHSASLLRDDEGSPVFYVHQFADHSEAYELRRDLEYRASHDPLTGVVNRGELMTQLAHSLRRGQGAASWLGVLFCDIDNLKPLNDEYGHHTGDVAITTVAARLKSAVRGRDLVARIGGDEFVVLLEGLPSREELAKIAEKCRAAVAGPIEVDGHEIEVSVSVGAVLADHDESPDEVLARADHALHRAKAGGRRQVDVD